MLRFCAFLLAAALALPVAAQTLTGPVRVVDADTIDIGAPETVRLLGIDAAEGAQTCRSDDGAVLPCGRMATEAARRLYEGRVARCDVRRIDRFGRFIATCAVSGRDMGAMLVEAGIARTYRDDPTYAEQEKAAILFRRGLWAYDMQDPAAWRDGQRADRIAPRPDGCAIKGNISGSGRIYHLPGSRSYERTRIDESNGERWFCSESEARAAGWRAPRG